MPATPTGFVRQDQLEREVEKAIAKLSKKDVVRVRYTFKEDSTGDSAIFFRIVLKDSASQPGLLADVADRVSTTIDDELRPLENWGLLTYFNFRSKSEQDTRSEPEWA